MPGHIFLQGQQFALRRPLGLEDKGDFLHGYKHIMAVALSSPIAISNMSMASIAAFFGSARRFADGRHGIDRVI